VTLDADASSSVVTETWSPQTAAAAVSAEVAGSPIELVAPEVGEVAVSPVEPEPTEVTTPRVEPESSFVEVSGFGEPADTCANLAATFAEAPIVGGDYQRVFVLPDGDVLWLLQDVFVPTSSGPRLVHNAGLLQRDGRTELLVSAGPSSYLFADQTDRYHHWYWPLDGSVGSDGALHVFVAEMVEHGSRYLSFVEPVATWVVTIDTATMDVVDRRPAPDPSNALYGWSVVSADEYTYLFAHCYRQFGWDELWFAPEVRAHDLDCTADVTVARVPKGQFSVGPEYWDGSGWNPDPSTAVAVIPTEQRAVNPTQVELLDGVFVAVTKVDDWWGRELVLDTAPAAEGPWTTYATVPTAPPCDHCNTYFASIVPFGVDDATFVVALSCNDWEGVDLEYYRPMFLRVPRPG
jgi:hypothetical protein